MEPPCRRQVTLCKHLSPSENQVNPDVQSHTFHVSAKTPRQSWHVSVMLNADYYHLKIQSKISPEKKQQRCVFFIPFGLNRSVSMWHIGHLNKQIETRQEQRGSAVKSCMWLF